MFRHPIGVSAHVHLLEHDIWCFLLCTLFGHLILGKIIKSVATRCRILTSKCSSNFNFGWGSALDLTRELTALKRRV